MFWELSGDCRTSPKYSCSGPKLLDTLVKELLGGPISQKILSHQRMLKTL